MRCPFCHNASLVKGGDTVLTEEELFAFLNKRRGLLDGVCITGGEPLIHPDIEELIVKIRALGYKVKLDTNGTFPRRLKPLLEKGLLDYVAMDLKNAPALYGDTVGLPGFDFAPVAECMELLRASTTAYEYRTTVADPLHNIEGLKALAALIQQEESWYLQQYIDSGDILGSGVKAFKDEEMGHFAEVLRPLVPKLSLRGVQ